MEAVTDTTRQEYEAFLANHSEANFLQSWQWGEVHTSLGDKLVRGGIKKDGQLVAIWTGIVKNAKRGRYLEVPGGPIMDWEDESLVKLCLERLYELAKPHECAFVRFRPQVENDSQMLQVLQQNKAKKAPMHLHAEHTSLLDITPGEDALLAGMRRQTRYEVRQVAKKGLKISNRMPSESDIDEFYDIQAETAKRHGFVQSSRQFFHNLAKEFGDDLRLYRAEKDGQLLNLAVVISWGDEVDYYEAASTPGARNLPGAYGIIWQIIKDAKKAKKTRLNLWGIAYSDDPNHRYAGVTTFKRGFGGQDVEYVPAHDLVINPTRYGLNWAVETIRRKKRGL